jgi:hypothetical protein
VVLALLVPVSAAAYTTLDFASPGPGMAVALILRSIGGYAAWRVSRVPPQDQTGRSG